MMQGERLVWIAAGPAIEAAVGLPAINEVIPDRPKSF
jgi:hypothetical protein